MHAYKLAIPAIHLTILDYHHTYGMSIPLIVELLNRQGLKRRGKEWNQRAVYYVIQKLHHSHPSLKGLNHIRPTSGLLDADTHRRALAAFNETAGAILHPQFKALNKLSTESQRALAVAIREEYGQQILQAQLKLAMAAAFQETDPTDAEVVPL